MMATGIGMVFIFLCLMVVVMMAVGAYFKANEERYREADSSAPSGAAAKPENIASVVAAIAVALDHMKPNTNKV